MSTINVNAAGVYAKTNVLIPKLQNKSTGPIDPPFAKYNDDGTIASKADNVTIV